MTDRKKPGYRRTALVLAVLTFTVVGAQPMDMRFGHARLQRCDSLYKSGDKQKALDVLVGIPEEDTLFERSLLLRMYLHVELKDLGSAEARCREGIRHQGRLSSDFRKELPAILYDQERYDEAVRAADTAITQLPGSFRPRLLKAKALLKKGEPGAALELAMENARRFPFQRNAHVMLAELAWSEGHLSEAAMALAMAQLVGVDAPNAEEMLIAYDRWLAGNGEPVPTGLDMSITGDDLKEIDQLLISRLAMDKKYKVKPNLEYATCRQSHLLFHAIAERPTNGGGFYERYYGPLLRAIVKEDRFEGFVHLCIAASSNKEVQADASKGKAKAAEFREWFLEHMKNNYLDRPWVDGGPVVTHVYNGNYDLSAYGPLDGSGALRVGEWTFFAPSGRMNARGTYDGGGQKTGDWYNWDAAGRIESVARYDKNELNGPFIRYFDNGNIMDSLTMLNGRREGPLHTYFRNGGKRMSKIAVNNLFEGPAAEFFPTGAVEWSYSFVNDKVHGPVTRYHPDGGTRMTGEYAEGLRNGTFKEHHENGMLMLEETYVSGKATGAYRRWYPDGTLAEEGMQDGDNRTGERRSFDAWGHLVRVEHYDANGKLHGTVEEFAEDGRATVRSEYSKGLLVRYVIYGEDGQVLSEGQRNKGRFAYKGYDRGGWMIAEGAYLDEGAKDGVWKYYHPDGTISGEEEYHNGEYLVGRDYDGSGALERITTDHDRDGRKVSSVVEHFRHGQVKAEAQKSDGRWEGLLRHYHPDGTMRRTEYYVNGELQGWRCEHDPRGHVQRCERFDDGAIVERTEHDEDGRIHERISVPPGPFELVSHLPNGKVTARLSMVNGYLHGPATWYYPDGTVSATGTYLNGMRHGTWEDFHMEGARTAERTYVMGDLHGTWQEWYPDGTLRSKAPFLHGSRHGAQLEYHRNGRLAYIREHAHGELHGRTVAHSEDGTPQMVRFYRKGRLWAYGSPQPDGSVVDTIRVKGGRFTMETRFPNGSTARTMFLRNSEIDGEFVEFHPNGQVMERTTYVVGSPEGASIEYHADGKPGRKEVYQHGMLHGEQVEHWENGKVRERREFVWGVAHGKWTVHDRNGERTVTYLMRNGEVVGIER